MACTSTEHVSYKQFSFILLHLVLTTRQRSGKGNFFSRICLLFCLSSGGSLYRPHPPSPRKGSCPQDIFKLFNLDLTVQGPAPPSCDYYRQSSFCSAHSIGTFFFFFYVKYSKTYHTLTLAMSAHPWKKSYAWAS